MPRRRVRPLHLVAFAGFFLVELVLANLRVARDVVSPGLRLQAAIVRFPTAARTPFELATLASTISMTPGSLCLEVDAERGELLLHTLYAPDRDQFLADVARTERMLLRALR